MGAKSEVDRGVIPGDVRHRSLAGGRFWQKFWSRARRASSVPQYASRAWHTAAPMKPAAPVTRTFAKTTRPQDRDGEHRRGSRPGQPPIWRPDLLRAAQNLTHLGL